MNIFNLFPTAIGQTELHRQLTDGEHNFLVDYQNKDVRKNDGNTYTGNNYILDAPELNELKKELTKQLNIYLNDVYKPKNDVEAYITISWINYTQTGQFHHAHSHVNSIFSGVYYADTNDDDTITFISPPNHPLRLRLETSEWNTWNSEEWWFPTPKNTLLLFPSTLAHKVNPTTNPNTRVSLAFNTFLRGKLDNGLNEVVL